MEIAKSLFRPTTLPDDVRVCDFCTTVGDGPTETCGRYANGLVGFGVTVTAVSFQTVEPGRWTLGACELRAVVGRSLRKSGRSAGEC